MGWLEAKYRRSEEKAERLQSEQIQKIQVAKLGNYALVSKLPYDKYGVSQEVIDIACWYLSTDTKCSDYSTDTYRLAKEQQLCGRIVKLDTLSPSFVQKYGMYEYLASKPASHRFFNAIAFSPLLREIIGLSYKYDYKSCLIYPFESVNVVFKHRDIAAAEQKEFMSDGQPALLHKAFRIVCEEDNEQVRTLYLLISADMITTA